MNGHPNNPNNRVPPSTNERIAMKKSYAILAGFAIALTGFLSSCDNYTTTPTAPAAAADTNTTPPWTATVTFKPAAGDYISAQSVLLSPVIKGDSIYYTVDGSIPTRASTLYTKAIPVSASTRIKAITANGGSLGTMSVSNYNITVVAISPATGTYASAQNVSLKSVFGAEIHYTVDGSVPTLSSPLYATAIAVKSTTTINAIAVTDGISSAMSSATYTIPLLFVPASGTFTSAQKVVLSTGTPGDTIYYTTNDSTPTISSTLYTDTIRLNSTKTIKAITVKAGKTSALYSAKYTISIPAVTFKPVAGVYTTAQSVVLKPVNAGDTVYYTIDGTNPTRSSLPYTGAITVSALDTIKAIAVNGATTSSVNKALYQFIPWQSGIAYGSVSDAAGKSYKTVDIGSQTWMAENLNYSGSGSSPIGTCYKSSADSCTKYGRLYTWAQVMSGATSSSVSPSAVQGLCPVGYHVPSNAEWTTMLSVVDPSGTAAGKKLKASMNAWKLFGTLDGNGTDAVGFRALPAGDSIAALTGGGNHGAGNTAIWWTATESDSTSASTFGAYFNNDNAFGNVYDKSIGYSLRCVKN